RERERERERECAEKRNAIKESVQREKGGLVLFENVKSLAHRKRAMCGDRWGHHCGAFTGHKLGSDLQCQPSRKIPTFWILTRKNESGEVRRAISPTGLR